jgi:hypothetical protein
VATVSEVVDNISNFLRQSAVVSRPCHSISRMSEMESTIFFHISQNFPTAERA